MPILGSNGRGAPNGWQWAYDAFQRLQRQGKIAGEPVIKWFLVFPTRTEHLRGRQWRLYYSENGKFYDIYVGWDARSTAKTIDRITEEMKKLAHNRNYELTTERVIHDQLLEEGKIRDPIFDPHFASTLAERWLRGTRNIRTREELERFKREHKNLMALLNRRAGYLNMSMLFYLTRHPDSVRWPNPPETEEEWFRRHPELRHRRKDSNA